MNLTHTPHLPSPLSDSPPNTPLLHRRPRHSEGSTKTTQREVGVVISGFLYNLKETLLILCLRTSYDWRNFSSNIVDGAGGRLFIKLLLLINRIQTIQAQ